MLLFAAASRPVIAPADHASLPYRGIRGSAAGTTTVTLTITAAQVAKDWAFSDRGHGSDTKGSVQLGLTDLICYTDTDSSVVTILSGADPIGSLTLDTGNFHHTFKSAIMADEGKDLVITITGATSHCSVFISGQGLFVHAR